MRKLLIASSTTFAVNAFLSSHIKNLSGDFEIFLVSSSDGGMLLPDVAGLVKFYDWSIDRKPNLVKDVLLFFKFLSLLLRCRPDCILTVTPKVGVILGICGFLVGIPRRAHIFSGQVWHTKTGFSRIFYKLLDTILAKTLTTPLADSSSQVKYLEDEKVAPKGRIQVLSFGSICGVNTRKFSINNQLRRETRDKYACVDSTFIVLFLGRMVQDKGVFDALAAVSSVTNINKDVCLWMVGPDEDGLTDEIKLKAISLNVNLKCFGKVAETIPYFSAADLLILPSKREGFGSVIIEAAACGLPALCYRTYGVIDALEDGKTGLLANYCDREHLSELLQCLINNRALLRNMSINARKRALEKFDEKILLKKLRDTLLQS